MPYYDFKCRQCGTEFEFLKLHSEEVVECPECKAQGPKNLEKQVSKGTSFSLKGGGWYRDGYGKGRKG